MNYLLKPYGFQIDDNPESNEQYLLLMLALPEPHRQLGPITLMDAVTTLGGASFRPLINPAKRTVRYQLRDGFGEFVNPWILESLNSWIWESGNPSAWEFGNHWICESENPWISESENPWICDS